MNELSVEGVNTGEAADALLKLVEGLHEYDESPAVAFSVTVLPRVMLVPGFGLIETEGLLLMVTVTALETAVQPESVTATV